MPSLRTRPKMDRGLYLVVQTRPGVCALYSIPVRLSACPHRYIIPYFRGTQPQPGGFLPKHRRCCSVAIPLHRCRSLWSLSPCGSHLRFAPARLHQAGSKTCQILHILIYSAHFQEHVPCPAHTSGWTRMRGKKRRAPVSTALISKII